MQSGSVTIETLTKINKIMLMATGKVVMHGRRKGTIVSAGPEKPADKSIQVAVLSGSEWQRMKDNLASWRDPVPSKAEKEEKRKKDLYRLSQDIVKNWENTIEGQRLKRLEAHQVREEQEEKERQKIDEQEAAFQAEERKKSIERAKTLLYYQTDRVKQLNGALLLSEVLRERDLQVLHKKKRENMHKLQDEAILEYQKKEQEHATILDMKAAEERAKENAIIAQFQSKQAAQKTEKKLQERLAALEDQKRQEIEAEELRLMRQAFDEDNMLRQVAFRKELDDELCDKLKRESIEKQQLQVEEDCIKIFNQTKKQMKKLRKEKELEIFQEFQNHQDRMCELLQGQLQQEATDEDQRIAKAVQEQDAKRDAELRDRQEKYMAATRDIHKHMLMQIAQKNQQKRDQEQMDQDMLKQRIIQDEKFRYQQLEKKMKARQEAIDLQQFHQSQTKELKARKQADVNEDVAHYHRNLDLLGMEEVQFQQYAKRITSEAEERGAPLWPLIAAAREGAGGGHGPILSKSRTRPSYQVKDATALELPSYSQEKSSKKTNTQKRLGFTW